MTSILYAAGGQVGGSGGSGNPILNLLPFLLIILVMYFLMIRPQAKKQREKQNMLQQLKAGDDVLTIGGIYGHIEGIREKDNILILRVAKDVKVHISRSAIAEKLEKKVVS